VSCPRAAPGPPLGRGPRATGAAAGLVRVRVRVRVRALTLTLTLTLTVGGRLAVVVVSGDDELGGGVRQRWRRRRWLLGQPFGECAASGEGGALLAVGGVSALPDRDLVRVRVRVRARARARARARVT